MVSPSILQLLGQSSGFQVAATQKPCTKGLWMWSTPIKRTAADGSEYNLILLDSEGIDSYDQTVSLQFFSEILQLLDIKQKIGLLSNSSFMKIDVGALI